MQERRGRHLSLGSRMRQASLTPGRAPPFSGTFRHTRHVRSQAWAKARYTDAALFQAVSELDKIGSLVVYNQSEVILGRQHSSSLPALLHARANVQGARSHGTASPRRHATWAMGNGLVTHDALADRPGARGRGCLIRAYLKTLRRDSVSRGKVSVTRFFLLLALEISSPSAFKEGRWREEQPCYTIRVRITLQRDGAEERQRSKARASAKSKYTKNNQHWVSISVRPFALSSFALAAHYSLLSRLQNRKPSTSNARESEVGYLLDEIALRMCRGC